MATMDEYQAIHGGKQPPRGKGTANDFGGGGCIIIFKDKGGVVGRWNSWDTASLALNKLQKLGGGAYDYRLKESHQWVKGLGNTVKCSLCSITREVPASGGWKMEINW